jgi:glycosyltransferase involved in cell wall biosynthesis
VSSYDVTFIIPALNVEKTIELCLRSIFDQKTTFKFEVIVVDNCSTDETARIVRQFPAQLLTCHKPGASSARNIGIERATGRWLAFVDGDVVLDLNWLQQLMENVDGTIFVATQSSIVSSGLGQYSYLDKFRFEYTKFLTRGTFCHAEVEKNNPIINTAACLYLKERVLKVNCFDEDLVRCEDTDLTNKILVAGGHICSSQASSAKVFWDKSVMDYFLRAFKVGYYHTLLRIIWYENKVASVRYNGREAFKFFSLSSLFFYFPIRTLQILGSLGALVLVKRKDFEDKTQYFKNAVSNVLLYSCLDDSLRKWMLSPAVRIVKNSSGFMLIDLKNKAHHQTNSEVAKIFENCISSVPLNREQEGILLCYLKDKKLVV